MRQLEAQILQFPMPNKVQLLRATAEP